MRMRNGWLGIVGVAAAVPLVLGGVSGAADAQQAARTCRGVPATIVGSGKVLLGTPGRDVIVATSPETRVRAGGGDDLVCGSRRVHGERGDDEIHYDGRTPFLGHLYIVGGTGDDVIRFHGKQNHPSRGTRDGVYGGAGRDLIVGAGGSLWMIGGSGPDRLVSGPGGDLMDGGPGDDVLLGGRGQEIMFGGGGDDLLRGRAHSDDLSGGPGYDEVWGGPDWDVCAGGNEIEHSCEADDWV